MASLRKESDRNRTGWRLQFRQNGKRRSLWIGSVSKRVAETVARHVEELARAADANVTAAAEAVTWAQGVDQRMHETLSKWGLVETRKKISADLKLCGPFFEKTISDRWEGRTARNYRQGARSFTDRFGADRRLASITQADFEGWHRWMKKQGLAEATANKRAKMVRTLLKEAVKDRIITTNPGDGYKIGGEVNRSRDFYVTPEATAAILERCDTEWGLIVGLCRYAGFRCPSEVQALTWSDVQWDANRLRIDSPKTGLRFTPIFAPLRPLLDQAWADLGDRPAVHVIERYRDREANLRTQFHRIIESAGLVPWEKCFVNLRASCRTDLEETYPNHVVNSWIGHSARVAERHYLQTTDLHWEKAANQDPFGGVTGGVLNAHRDPSAPIGEHDGEAEQPVLAGADAGGGTDRYAQEDSNLRPTD